MRSMVTLGVGKPIKRESLWLGHWLINRHDWGFASPTFPKYPYSILCRPSTNSFSYEFDLYFVIVSLGFPFTHFFTLSFVLLFSFLFGRMFKTSIMTEIIEFFLSFFLCCQMGSRDSSCFCFVGAMGIAKDVFQYLKIRFCLDIMVFSGPVCFREQFVSFLNEIAAYLLETSI